MPTLLEQSSFVAVVLLVAGATISSGFGPELQGYVRRIRRPLAVVGAEGGQERGDYGVVSRIKSELYGGLGSGLIAADRRDLLEKKKMNDTKNIK